MVRLIPIVLLALVTLGGSISVAGDGDGDCCGHCGCKLHCKVMCEWETYEVRRYKAEHTECPPPCCVCCDDRWIIGCPKPIKIMSLKPYYEKRKRLIGQYVVRTCPHCEYQDSAPLAPEKE